ncbi:hypothetical protein IQ06DRAFT_56084 [Phaeosphaeriaceae sp. SRC1lsM3a]|nr:hypothetical protein IQ06DRAFT_56084 [Stagonospora sp. SRC1lsM3a]
MSGSAAAHVHVMLHLELVLAQLRKLSSSPVSMVIEQLGVIVPRYTLRLRMPCIAHHTWRLSNSTMPFSVRRGTCPACTLSARHCWLEDDLRGAPSLSAPCPLEQNRWIRRAWWLAHQATKLSQNLGPPITNDFELSK